MGKIAMVAADLAAGTRLLVQLPGFLRHPVHVEQARAILRQRLESREADFLDLVRRTIFGTHAASPYRALLTMAGCECGDVERLVNEDGVEGALHVLLRHGVYLTVDELKGRRAVVRGSFTLDVAPAQLRNPFSTTHVRSQTGGSRGPGTRVALDLTFIKEMSVNYCLVAASRGEQHWVHAVWLVPSGDAIVKILRHTGFGAVPVRWFSQISLNAPEVHPRYRWGARVLRWGGRLAGVRLPIPEHVAIDDPSSIVRWMANVLRQGRTPHLITLASSAVRVCEAALSAGVDLRGAQFTLTGEPTTASRLAVVRAAGGEALPFYATTEVGIIGLGCLAPDAPDDVHLFHDRVAVIQATEARAALGLSSDALFVSSVRVLGSPMIMLNVSLGDQAAMTSRRCGCPLELLGWRTHLHTIRSYEKLTAAGMTFLDSDLIRVLEEVLPRRFGGGPADYQLVEEELENGRPQLRLLVHPAIGRVDIEAVATTFLAAVGRGSGGEPLMAHVWRDAKVLRIERRAPLATPSGKILHLHVERHTSPEGRAANGPSPGTKRSSQS